jgi:hypothetical protein
VTPPELADHLRPGERVLWWGRARQGGVSESVDLAPTILASGAGLTLLTLALLRVMAGATDVIVSVALVLLGLCHLGFAVAGAIAGARHRRESIYAITNQRLLFLLWQWRGGPKYHTLPLTEPMYPSVNVSASGAGTISFKPDQIGWRREVRRIERWTFEGVADVRAVYEIYQRAADDARHAAWRRAAHDGR